MEDIPSIYYINGMFLLFDEKSILKLRSQRIFGQFIGCTPKNPHQVLFSGIPCYLSHYATKVALDHKLASFSRLISRDDIINEERKRKFVERLSSLKETAHNDFTKRRADELKKRDLDITDSRLGRFDEKKLKLSLEVMPDIKSSSFVADNMSDNDVKALLTIQDDKMKVYQDLYNRGFYVSSGMKFGTDFLAYSGDPIRYHAEYAVKVVDSFDGQVNLNRVDYCEINALQRLTHTANKIPLFAAVSSDSESIKYWTLRTREYLLPKSSPDTFELADPTSRSF